MFKRAHIQIAFDQMVIRKRSLHLFEMMQGSILAIASQFCCLVCAVCFKKLTSWSYPQQISLAAFGNEPYQDTS